jgi:hypothetical protein
MKLGMLGMLVLRRVLEISFERKKSDLTRAKQLDLGPPVPGNGILTVERVVS